MTRFSFPSLLANALTGHKTGSPNGPMVNPRQCMTSL